MMRGPKPYDSKNAPRRTHNQVNMSRLAISRGDLSIPSSDDFIATFGCVFSFDELSYTENYVFADDYNSTIYLWIGIADNTFSLSIKSDDFETVKIYSESLQKISLDEKRQSIIIVPGTSDLFQQMQLKIWPRASLHITTTRREI
ncbi:hypothetical protein [Agrobacterium sp. Azo12]|uniref:hypothetical protein n=1 Tax=Agrobacterium sp. Azo12 TaxID=3031129 RepID=UPI0023D80B4B|nr:hypothetical protein [Agrobacterium sp. Azo12]MDO5897873.1 hypothetical protein [Agrobacterium sp. Azo12]